MRLLLQGCRNDFGIGGAKKNLSGFAAQNFFYHTFLSKGYNFVHKYICNFQYPLSY